MSREFACFPPCRLQEYEQQYLEEMKQLYGDMPLVSMEGGTAELKPEQKEARRQSKKNQRRMKLGFQYSDPK
jgi:hypothetical protein